jgi:hypothetical protein
MPRAGYHLAPVLALEHPIDRGLGHRVAHGLLERGLEQEPGADLSPRAFLEELAHERLFLGQAEVGPLALASPGRVDPCGAPAVIRPQQVTHGVRGEPHMSRDDGSRLGVYQRMADDHPPANPPGFTFVFDARIECLYR